METWSISWAVRNLLSELLTPPGIWIVWVLLMLFFIKKHEFIKKTLITVGFVMIWVTSTNYFAVQFTNVVGYWMEWPAHVSSLDSDSTEFSNNAPHPKSEIVFAKEKDIRKAIKTEAETETHKATQKGIQKGKIASDISKGNSPSPQAIVILGGGRRKGALETTFEYQQQDLSPSSMERLRHGARLAKKTKLPILVTGGAPDKTSKEDLSEAFVMKLVLEQELGLSPQWLEEQSNTTQENAKLTARILKNEGLKTIYLVTHFWHMPRAKAVFEKEGLIIVPAPMGFYQKTAFTPLDFYPGSEGFQRTRWIWHEILGNLWYRVKF
jgi:uncharacterized SAM-binding protein YcdF (DUF218 family)